MFTIKISLASIVKFILKNAESEVTKCTPIGYAERSEAKEDIKKESNSQCGCYKIPNSDLNL